MAFEVYEGLSEYEIFDFHTHPYINPRRNRGIYPHLLALDTPEALAEDLAKSGISGFAGSVLGGIDGGPANPTGDFAQIAAANEEALALCRRLGEVYYPGIHIHPAFVDESCREIGRAADLGFRLVGELVHYAFGWDFSHPGLLPILEHAQGRGMVLSLHVSDVNDIAGAAALADKFPALPIILAHPGDGARPRAHAEAMRNRKNMAIDLSGGGLFRYGTLSFLVRELGAERVLFGTDYPICTPSLYVGGVLSERVTREELALVFAGNAKRILGIA